MKNMNKRLKSKKDTQQKDQYKWNIDILCF